MSLPAWMKSKRIFVTPLLIVAALSPVAFAADANSGKGSSNSPAANDAAAAPASSAATAFAEAGGSAAKAAAEI